MQNTRNDSDRQERKRNPLHVHTPPPKHAEGQLKYVLRLLEERGEEGVPRYDLIYGVGVSAGRRVSQCGARIHELESQGYIITSKFVGHDNFVTYFLKYKPTAPAPVRGWKAAPFVFGRKAAPVPEHAPVQQTLLADLVTASSTSNQGFLAAEMGKLLW